MALQLRFAVGVVGRRCLTLIVRHESNRPKQHVGFEAHLAVVRSVVGLFGQSWHHLWGTSDWAILHCRPLGNGCHPSCHDRRQLCSCIVDATGCVGDEELQSHQMDWPFMGAECRMDIWHYCADRKWWIRYRRGVDLEH